MRAIIQRVSAARVVVEGRVVGQCGFGFLALIGAHREDTEADAKWMADRIAKLRVFSDAEGKMNLALGDVGGSVLAVSNFTVYGDALKCRRPSFVASAAYEQGERLFEACLAELRALGVEVQTGVFGAHMEVHLTNDGPVTLVLDSR